MDDNELTEEQGERRHLNFFYNFYKLLRKAKQQIEMTVSLSNIIKNIKCYQTNQAWEQT